MQPIAHAGQIRKGLIDAVHLKGGDHVFYDRHDSLAHIAIYVEWKIKNDLQGRVQACNDSGVCLASSDLSFSLEPAGAGAP